MNNLPPSHSNAGGSMRIGPFWKRAADESPGPLGPAGDEPFDALTDLFLGEVASSRLPAAAKGSARGEPARATSATNPATPTPPPKPGGGPILRLAGADEDEEYQLVPTHGAMDMESVATRAAAPVLMMATAMEEERHAERGTTQQRHAERGGTQSQEQEQGEARPLMGVVPPVRHPVLEMLVLGNLPVLAGAWANQYVREIAEAAGKPVAYLRTQGEFVSLEVIGALADVAGAPRAEDLGSLDDAIDAAAEITDRWIVRCDAGQEPAVLASTITRAVTILTGADQTAREACKVTLAGLADRLPAPSPSGPMVRLALMGAANAPDGTAQMELAALASTTLARPVAAIACAGKIGGVRPPHTLFSGSTELTLKTILSSVERALVADVVGTGVFARPAQSALASTAYPPAQTVEPIQEAAEDVEDSQTVDEVIVSATARDAPELATPADVRIAPGLTMAEISLPEPRPTTAEIAAGLGVRERMMAERAEIVEPKVVAPVVAEFSVGTTAKATLASHLADLRSTSLRCPYASGIEIAIDGAGALHLLARESKGTAEDSTLAALLVASSWAQTHAAMLGPAAGVQEASSTQGSAARPTMHLFTDRPKASRRLLETNLRVHLLAEVRVGAEQTWYCADLN